MKIISWNVNGIRAIAKKGFLDFIEREKPDVLCLQETKAEVSQLPGELINIPGYLSFFSHSKTKKGYSGVACYTKIEPNEVIEIFNGGNGHHLDIEGRLLILKFKKFTLLNVYFPNGKMSDIRLKYKMEFYNSFLKYINKLRDKGEKVIFCGDVNTAHKAIDLARPKANEKISGFLPEERAWMDKVVDNDWIDTFRMHNDKPEQYSWWSMLSSARSRNIGWRIDYFFVDKKIKAKIKNAFILQEVLGSDHAPVGIEADI